MGILILDIKKSDLFNDPQKWHLHKKYTILMPTETISKEAISNKFFEDFSQNFLNFRIFFSVHILC